MRPTFDGQKKSLEVHIFEFNQMIYGKTVQIRFFDRLRDEQKFDGLDELKAQLNKDKLSALAILAK